MRKENGQIKELMDGTEANDAANVDQSTGVWVSGQRKILTKRITTTAVTATGQAVFYLTDNNASNGNAVFTNVYKSTANFWVDNASIQYQFGNYTVSGDKKTLTVNVNQLGSVILGLIDFVAAANGITVHLTIMGD